MCRAKAGQIAGISRSGHTLMAAHRLVRTFTPEAETLLLA